MCYAWDECDGEKIQRKSPGMTGIFMDVYYCSECHIMTAECKLCDTGRGRELRSYDKWLVFEHVMKHIHLNPKNNCIQFICDPAYKTFMAKYDGWKRVNGGSGISVSIGNAISPIPQILYLIPTDPYVFIKKYLDSMREAGGILNYLFKKRKYKKDNSIAEYSKIALDVLTSMEYSCAFCEMEYDCLPAAELVLGHIGKCTSFSAIKEHY